MVRKKARKYLYVCALSKAGKGCSSHCLSPDLIECAVKGIIERHIAVFCNSQYEKERGIPRLNEQIANREREINDCERYRQSLYGDFKNGIISIEDCVEFEKDYDERIAELRTAVSNLKKELNIVKKELNDFKKEDSEKIVSLIPELSRQIAVCLIERINVYKGKRVEIILRYRDEIFMML